VGNEVDDCIKADVKRGNLARPRVQPDVQILINTQVIAELYEGFAADRLTRLELRDPRRRCDCECSRRALLDLGQFGLFDLIAHDCILMGVAKSSPAVRQMRMSARCSTAL
jgi:hypothetical protein